MCVSRKEKKLNTRTLQIRYGIDMKLTSQKDYMKKKLTATLSKWITRGKHWIDVLERILSNQILNKTK